MYFVLLLLIGRALFDSAKESFESTYNDRKEFVKRQTIGCKCEEFWDKIDEEMNYEDGDFSHGFFMRCKSCEPEIKKICEDSSPFNLGEWYVEVNHEPVKQGVDFYRVSLLRKPELKTPFSKEAAQKYYDSYAKAEYLLHPAVKELNKKT
jgi:hypothetical protein